MTRGEKITLFAALGAVILSVILNIGVREWYASDIRYEEGGYYISGNTAITSLKLTNIGHSDAEDIIINLSFNRPIVDISTDEQSLNFSVISGGKGTNHVSCKIARIVPGQELYLFYAVNYEKITPAELSKQFVSGITFKGGRGKTIGKTSKFLVGLFVTIIVILSVIVIIWAGLTGYWENKKLYEDIFNNVDDINILNDKATLEKNPKEIIRLKIENYIKDINANYRYKQKLYEYALRKFNLSNKDNEK